MMKYDIDESLTVSGASRYLGGPNSSTEEILENGFAAENHEGSNDADISSIIFLLCVLLFVFMFSVFKYWLCEGPMAEKRRRREREIRKQLIREQIVSKTVIRKERNHNISSGKIEQEYESRSTFDDDGLGEERVTGEDVKDRENREFIHRYHRQKTNLEISTSHHNLDDDTTRLECQICLADFQVGEQICWSNNPECVHTFHIACLEPWLMNHDECPLCRNPYLVRPKKSPVAEVEVNDFEQEVITRSNMTPITHHVVTALSLFAPRQHNRDSASHDNPNEENASDPEACRAGAPIDQMPTEEATNEVNSDVEPQITIEEPIR